jgi:hypothetical protein
MLSILADNLLRFPGSAAAAQPVQPALLQNCRPRPLGTDCRTGERQTDGTDSFDRAAPGFVRGGFGYYRGGYYGRGGPVGIGGILGLILVVVAIGWLVHGHIGGLYF